MIPFFQFVNEAAIPKLASAELSIIILINIDFACFATLNSQYFEPKVCFQQSGFAPKCSSKFLQYFPFIDLFLRGIYFEQLQVLFQAGSPAFCEQCLHFWLFSAS